MEARKQPEGTQEIMQQLAESVGITGKNFRDVRDFLKQVAGKKGVAGIDQLIEVTGLQKSFLLRVFSSGQLPRQREERLTADARYGRIAEALGLEEALFLKFIETAQLEKWGKPEESTGASEELTRGTRIRVIRLLNDRMPEDPAQCAQIEMAVEKILEEFAGQIQRSSK